MKIIAIIIWLLFGLYFGLGGLLKAELEEGINLLKLPLEDTKESVVYEGITFSSREALEMHLKIEKIILFFPWVYYLPSIVVIVFTSGAFGALGGVTRIVKQLAIAKISISDIAVVSIPLFGFLIGILLLGIASVIPAALTASKVDIQPTTLLFICLFGGVYSEHVYKWLESQIKHIFQSN